MLSERSGIVQEDSDPRPRDFVHVNGVRKVYPYPFFFVVVGVVEYVTFRTSGRVAPGRVIVRTTTVFPVAMPLGSDESPSIA